MAYDNTVLDFESADPGDAPFVVEGFESVDEIAGTIDYASAVVSGGSGTEEYTVMARITFTALVEVCNVVGLVSFRVDDPPTRLSGEFGGDILPTLIDLGSISLDAIPPVITCPPDTQVETGDAPDPSNTGQASGTDNCDVSPVVGLSDSVAPPPSICPVLEVITRTWTVTDACGHSDTCDQTIDVIDVDFDGDGVVDCDDGCPHDPNKTAPGICGCGISDVDSDSDTIPDCHDQCPGEDDRIDADGDGTPDCLPTIPTASGWGLLLMTLLLFVAARIFFGGRKTKA